MKKPKMEAEARQARIIELGKILEANLAARDAYYKASFERDRLTKEEQGYQKNIKYNKITTDTWYQEPEYPDMGVAGQNGSAVFKTEEQAKELVSVLNERSSYYYVYKMNTWEGPGNYDVIPSYNLDHDGEIVYTATFKKASNE